MQADLGRVSRLPCFQGDNFKGLAPYSCPKDAFDLLSKTSW